MDYFDEFDARKSGVWVEILRQSKWYAILSKDYYRKQFFS